MNLFKWMFSIAVFFILLIGSAVFDYRWTDSALAKDVLKKGAITKLRVEPLYRSVRITWKIKKTDDHPVTFEIYRSMAGPKPEYELVAAMKNKPDVKKYKYLDKKLPVEENYLYKIVIPETNESFGPLKVRPPFSLPTT